ARMPTLDVFPYVADRVRTLEMDQEHFVSEPYSGDPKVLTRGNFRRGFALIFTTRTQAEYLAAETFFSAHPPPTHFIFRDYRFLPYRESEVMFTSTFKEQGSQVSLRFSYSFEIKEVG